MKKVLLYSLLITLTVPAFSQGVGIGTNSPHASALLELKSNTKGLIFPRTSTSSRLSMTGVKGLFVYDTTFNSLYYHNGSIWNQIASGTAINYWNINGTHIYNNNTGNVGIGTTSPPYKFSVIGDIYISGNTPTLRITGDANDIITRMVWTLPAYADDYNLGQYQDKFYISRATGTLGLTTDMVFTNTGAIGIGTSTPTTRLQVIGGTDVGNTTGGYLQLGVDGALNVAFDNNEIQARDANGVARLTLNNGGGAVQIGPAQVPVGYLFAVDGKIICEELKIQNSGGWPDYVFHENYVLRPLHELREFISRENHLPGIPDANTVAENGITIGEMQKLMMEKIEELTLYILQLEARNQILEQRVKILEQ